MGAGSFIAAGLLFLKYLLGDQLMIGKLKIREPFNPAIILILLVIGWLIVNRDRVGGLNPHGLAGIFLLITFLTMLHYDRPPLAVTSDGVGYFSYLHSLVIDRDLDFANEYRELDAYRFGVHAYADESRRIPKTTPIGMIPNLFSIGPSLLWYPFYALTDFFYRPHHPDRTGYEIIYIQVLRFSMLLYGFLGLFLLYRSLATLFTPAAALLSVTILIFHSPIYFYLKNQPFHSHIYSFFCLALFGYFFTKYRNRQNGFYWAVFGLLLGLAALMRWQNAACLLVPLFYAWSSLIWDRQNREASLKKILFNSLAMGLTFAVTISPQLLAFKILYGRYLVIPQGSDFVTFIPRWFWQVLFSPFHGLFYWHPVLLLALAGFVLGLKKRVAADQKLFFHSQTVGFGLFAYINSSISQFHGGGSFGGRRFIDSFVFLAYPLANSVERILDKKGWRFLFAVILNVFFLLNIFMDRAFYDVLIPHEQPVHFPKFIGAAFASLKSMVDHQFKYILFLLVFLIFTNLFFILFTRPQNSTPKSL